ncbi:MAG: hypothetical protein LQ340_001017 [Diploschistes diacapsis]|nr:MAG: hypothetical protein LQ340_001017 [Diploschistes diacapsis]
MTGSVKPYSWSLGSTHICIQCSSEEDVPPEAWVSWQDSPNSFLYLRERSSPLTAQIPGEPSPRVQADSSISVFQFGVSTMIKTYAWTEGMQLEGDTIDHVRKHHPNIPITSKIVEWVDKPWSRCFMVMYRAEGSLLNDVWFKMDQEQRMAIAREVALHVADMAEETSDLLQTVNKCGLEDGRFLGPPPDSHFKMPIGTPFLFPVLDPMSLKSRFQQRSTGPFPEIGQRFVLYQPDLHPANIFVKKEPGSEKWILSRIIDLGLVAYYPRMWVAAAPTRRWFGIDKGLHDDGRWDLLLRKALIDQGFDDPGEPSWADEYEDKAD